MREHQTVSKSAKKGMIANQKGVVLMISMIVLFVCATMAAYIYKMASQDLFYARYLIESTKAQYNAEAGVAYALNGLYQEIMNVKPINDCSGYFVRIDPNKVGLNPNVTPTCTPVAGTNFVPALDLAGGGGQTAGADTITPGYFNSSTGLTVNDDFVYSIWMSGVTQNLGSTFKKNRLWISASDNPPPSKTNTIKFQVQAPIPVTASDGALALKKIKVNVMNIGYDKKFVITKYQVCTETKRLTGYNGTAASLESCI